MVSSSTYTKQEHQLSIYVNLIGVMYFCLVLFYIGGSVPFIHYPPSIGGTLLFTNKFLYFWMLSKNILITAILRMAEADTRRSSILLSVIRWLFIVNTFAGIAVMYAIPETFSFNIGSTIFEVVVLILFEVFYFRAMKARFQLKYLWPSMFMSIKAIAETSLEQYGSALTAEQIAMNTDTYLSSFRDKNKWQFKFLLFIVNYVPILYLKPLLTHMSIEKREEWLKWIFSNKRVYLNGFVSTIFRGTFQIAYIGYYNDTKAYQAIGYTIPNDRKVILDRLSQFPPAPVPKLQVSPPKNTDADVVIIGTGAGASIMAHTILSKNDGRKVVMVERGLYVPRNERKQDNEMEMLSKLYSDGAFELSTNQKFSVLQGMTVGGGTEVNNAICFDTPQKVLDNWNKAKNLGLNLGYYHDILKYINTLIGKQATPTPNNQFTNPGGKAFFEGLQQLGYPKPGADLGYIAANIESCVGCGMCITGCTYGSKQSMSERILPSLKNTYGDRLEILERTEVVKLVAKGNSIYSLKCKDENGHSYEIKGKKFVVSAGAISSSAILHRSGLNIPNVGKHLSFNITTPLTSFFQNPLYAYNGLPMAHYVEDPNLPFISETWFASPMMYALSMPGWFDNHYNNMLNYNNLATAGVLVGTDNKSFVTKSGQVNFQPTEVDLRSLYQGLEFTAKVFLAAGASKVVPNTFTYKEFTSMDQISNGAFVDHISQKDELAIMSAHPQGGNVMSNSPKDGTVDPTGKIWNYQNVFIADGSVFPTSVGVNPQVSIMAMSKYIAQHV